MRRNSKVLLKEVGRSITQNGLFHPILVRPVGERFELIAGERRFRAARDYTDMETMEAKVVEADDIGETFEKLPISKELEEQDLLTAKDRIS